MLYLTRNVGLGENQRFTRYQDNALIGAAAGGWWQFRDGGSRDVYADDGEIAGLKLKNVRAAVEGDCATASGVRIGAESAEEFDWHVHCAATIA